MSGKEAKTKERDNILPPATGKSELVDLTKKEVFDNALKEFDEVLTAFERA